MNFIVLVLLGFGQASAWPILQGMTNESSVQFSVVHPANSRTEFVVKIGSREWEPESLSTKKMEFSEFAVSKVFFSNLEGDGDYQLLVRIKKDKSVLESRKFGLLSPKEAPRIAVISCANESKYDPKVWSQVFKEKPDLVVFAGDNIYGDHLRTGEKRAADRAQLWRRYLETRETLLYYNQNRLIPTLATWDDHDIGLNNSGAAYPHFQSALEFFNAFYAQDADKFPEISAGPGIAISVNILNQNILLADNRSFRAPKEAGTTHLGAEQIQWIASHLRGDELNWIVSGSQFFGGYTSKGESYERDQPKEFVEFIQALKKVGNPFFLVSGDRHYTEISRLESQLFGFLTLELTSSSIHSSTFPGFERFLTNPRRVESTSAHNFVMVEPMKDSKGFNLKLRAVGEGGTLFKHQARVEIPTLL